jgi:predicted DNA-binding ribbon-helix-helix protein
MDSPASLKKVRSNVTMKGIRTSFALEAGVWSTLTEICRREELSLDELFERIVASRRSPDISMASAIRMYTLGYFRDLVLGDEGFGKQES